MVAFAVLVITFAMLHLVPGNVVDVIAGPSVTPEIAAELRDSLGLNKPLPTQFFDYSKGVLTGDLGTSFVSHEPVATIIGQRLPYTLELAGLGVALGLLIAVPWGVVAAVRQTHQPRRGISFALSTTVLAAAPDFLVATLLASAFAVYLRWLPVAGATHWDSIILPASALAIPLAGLEARVVRASVVEILNQPFMRTLRAAGVSDWRILPRDVLPNAAIPVITVMSVDFGRLLAGALIVENVFAWPGIGTSVFYSISSRDLPAVQGEILVLALIVVGVNLVIDVLYRLIDSRIQTT